MSQSFSLSFLYLLFLIQKFTKTASAAGGQSKENRNQEDIKRFRERTEVVKIAMRLTKSAMQRCRTAGSNLQKHPKGLREYPSCFAKQPQIPMGSQM
jgi:hypothetical protein